MANVYGFLGFKVRTVLRHKRFKKNHADEKKGQFKPIGHQGTILFAYCTACFCHRDFHQRVEVKVDGKSDDVSVILFKCPTIGDVTIGKGKKTEATQARPWLENVENAPKVVGFCNKLKGLAIPRNVKTLKKPKRIKATPEQGEMLKAFAEIKGWRLPKREETNEDVIHFCSEIGLPVQFVKNWINNNRRRMFPKQPLLVTYL